jgi:hypothetical protein
MSVGHLEEIEEEEEEDSGLPPDNDIIDVPIGFQLPVFLSEESQRRISRNKGGAGSGDKASLDTNMSQGPWQCWVP